MITRRYPKLDGLTWTLLRASGWGNDLPVTSGLYYRFYQLTIHLWYLLHLLYFDIYCPYGYSSALTPYWVRLPVPLAAVFSLRRVINVVLQGTPLGSPTDDSGNFLLKNVPAGTYTLVATGVGYKASKQNITVAAGRTITLGLRLAENQQVLTQVTVTGMTDAQLYSEPVSEIGTRTSARLLDVPQAIQVVPQQVLRDQQAQTLTEGLRNVAGVATYSNYMDYVLRGFRTNFNGSNFTTNGVRGVFYDFSQIPQLYNVERIEVVKGPGSVLFSAGAPGGIINTVTKQPLDHTVYETSLTVGSFGQRRRQGPAGGYVTAPLWVASKPIASATFSTPRIFTWHPRWLT